MKPKKFTAKICKIGINPVVDPPDKVLASIFDQAGRSKGPIPVCGKINGSDFVQTLVRFNGLWRLYINGPMLKDSGLKVGDIAEIEVGFDPRPREVPMPAALSAVLKRNAKARAAFDSLAPSRRKEILKYIGSLKSETAIEKNVARVISQLTGGGDSPVFMRANKKGGE